MRDRGRNLLVLACVVVSIVIANQYGVADQAARNAAKWEYKTTSWGLETSGRFEDYYADYPAEGWELVESVAIAKNGTTERLLFVWRRSKG